MFDQNFSFSLALGGGGVKGLAHIALLKVLDQWDIKPKTIAGTSIGAIIGALYANGISGAEIESRIRDHIIVKGEKPKSVFNKRKNLLKWAKLFKLDRSRGGIFRADRLFDLIFFEIMELSFEDLKIPFSAIATDFYSGEEVVLNSGKLRPAVQASMCVPGVFPPVYHNNQLLIDGGTVNNVPTSAVYSDSDYVLASDVIGLPRFEEPSATQIFSGAFHIMIHAATKLQFMNYPPHFLFQPDTHGIDAFDFHRIEEVFDRADEAAQLWSEQMQGKPTTKKASCANVQEKPNNTHVATLSVAPQNDDADASRRRDCID